MTAQRPSIKKIVDTDRYPLDAPDSERYGEALAECRTGLRGEGCAKLPGFVRASAMPALVEEAEGIAALAHRSYNETTPYFQTDDPSFPEDHPRRRFYPRSNAFVPADNFGPQSILRRIYEWPAFTPFMKVALEEKDFYRYGDPLADVIINVVEPGDGFPWHFDTNNASVTLAIRNGEAGGDFEYCPNLRTPEDENYEAVTAVLDGDRGPVHTLVLEPGDLQIFRGRFSLHRVTPVTGSRSRFVGIFSYAEAPDMIGRTERMMQLYGRVHPVHVEHEAALRRDSLTD